MYPQGPNYGNSRYRCPFCGFDQVDAVNFTWWGGMLGPKMLGLVKCRQCRKSYNGKSNSDATTGIIIYLVVSLVIGLIAGIIGYMAFAGRF
jgi:hypothetical protein